MSLVTRNNASPVPKVRSKRRKIARIAVFTLVGLLIMGALLWMQRTWVATWMVRNSLSEQGIDADFSISHLTGSEAIIDQIHLSVHGREVFSASKVTANYEWRDAIKGQVKRVEIDSPILVIEMGAQGRIISPQLPKGNSDSNNDVPFPPEGIEVRDGRVDVNSPYGEIDAQASGTFYTPDRFSLSGSIKIDALKYQSLSSRGQSTFSLKRDASGTALKAQAVIPTWDTGTVSGHDLRVDLDLDVAMNETDIALKGPIKAQFRKITSSELDIKNGQISSTGLVKLPFSTTEAKAEAEDALQVSSAWTLDVDEATLKDIARRESLAETLTLQASLLGISTTAPFAPKLKTQVVSLLEEANINGGGHLDLTSQGISISLTQALKISGAETALTLSAAPTSPFYTFDRRGENLLLNFDASFEGQYDSKLTDAKLSARSLGGYDIQAVTAFNTEFRTHKTWRAKTRSGRAVRLAPLNAKIDYETQDDTRHIVMSGALDYDGDVPGGYVEGLTARGEMILALEGDSLTAWFNPARGSRLRIKEMDTVSDWYARDIELKLASSAPVYQRNSNRGLVETRVLEGQGSLVHKNRNMDLIFDFDTADITGTMPRKNGETVRQIWEIEATHAHMVSDTIPALGTDIRAPELSMTATLEPDAPLYFTADSPAIDVTTPQMIATQLTLSAAGTSDSLRADYADGMIRFEAMPLPPLPIEGLAVFASGAWAGGAVTHLERAKETPINMDYKFVEGEGSANVTVVDLPFTPRGLQPKHLLPAFGGKVAQVKGFVDAEIKLGFSAGQPLTSSAKTVLKNMSLGTLPGPIAGLNAELSFNSLYPPQTAGPQSLSLGSFDPGLPLENGEVSFELIPDGIKILSARWPMGDGFISLDPTEWVYSRSENRMTLRVEDVSLSEFLQGAGGENFKVTGDVTGKLPVVISGVNVLVENGILEVKDGGVIQYSSPQTNAAADNNEVAGYAFDALKDFEYKSLEARLNGPLDGDIDLRLVFAGRNRDVLGGAEFLFNVGIQGQLFNIARSFQTGQGITATVKDEIAARSKSEE